MRIIFTLILLNFIFQYTATAQSTGKVTGVIKDESGKLLSSVTVSLLKAKDSAMVKVAVSDEEGAYEFINIAAGKYVIAASSVGFVKVTSTPFDVAADNTFKVPFLH